jgi:prepilin-type N-terminal cleavage/methylation domain-containing protein
MKVRCRGFTLVELLASMALTTLVMLAIFQVLASIARQGRAMAAAERQTIEPWQADLVDSIRWDLSNATTATIAGNQLVVRGHGSLDRTTLSPRHVPVEVSYVTRSVSGRNWLVRREKPSDTTGWTAMVCPDVERFEIRPSDHSLTTGETIANSYVLQMQFTDGKAFTETIVLR